MKKNASPDLPFDASLFSPGERICVAVSGGADSTALLRILLAHQSELGIVLSVLHVEHGLRGAAAAEDAAFVTALAAEFNLPCQVIAVDTPQRIATHKESVEEAARNLRYQAFHQIVASGSADKVATAHTLDDQAETVLMKLLRGAWTEGLSGIHPTLPLAGGGENPTSQALCIRPLLNVTRAAIEQYLRALQQPWRQDETNDSTAFTRNRVRHQLMPAMREFNPRIAEALAHVAANARAEEQHWQSELSRLLPQLLLPGKPVRGGGRSVATTPGPMPVALEITRLQALDPGMRRRVLRAAAERCEISLDFEATERLIEMVSSGNSRRSIAKRLALPGGAHAELSARELRLEPASIAPGKRGSVPFSYSLPVPGSIEAPAFQAIFTATISFEGVATQLAEYPSASVCAWQPGDRITLAHSSGPKKVKEILERMGIKGQEREQWPVVVWQERIVWMRDVTVACDHRSGPVLLIRETRFETNSDN